MTARSVEKTMARDVFFAWIVRASASARESEGVSLTELGEAFFDAMMVGLFDPDSWGWRLVRGVCGRCRCRPFGRL